MPAMYGQNEATMVYMRPELMAWLENYAKENGMTKSGVLRELTIEHRRKVLAEKRAARRQRRRNAA